MEHRKKNQHMTNEKERQRRKATLKEGPNNPRFVRLKIVVNDS